MTSTFPSWVLEAAALPVAFAQVREDPLLDLWVVERLGSDSRVIMVASGGCTAALLAAASNVGRLHLVDPNPAQLALSRLKLRLLQTTDPSTRLALLGHAEMPLAERQPRLKAELAAPGLSRPIHSGRRLPSLRWALTTRDATSPCSSRCERHWTVLRMSLKLCSG